MLLEYFLISLRYIRMIGRACNSISEILMVNTVSLLPKVSQISSKILTDFGHQMSLGNMMLCHEDRHPLLQRYFLIFLRYIEMIGRASGSVSNILMVKTVSFPPK